MERARRNTVQLSSVIRGIELSGDSGLDSLKNSLLQKKVPTDDGILTAADVKKTLSDSLGSSLDLPDFESLSKKLRKRVFGQSKAIDRLCSAVVTAGLRPRENGLALSVLIYGESGTGKTLIASSLSEALYGEAPICFDLSEYADKGSVSSLIGSPPGYVGFGDEGALIRQIRSRPLSVLLFENVDRAHPDVISLVRGILEHGSITAPSGRVIELKGFTVILTVTIEGGCRTAGFGALTDDHGLEKALYGSRLSLLTDLKLKTEPLDDDARTSVARSVLDSISKSFFLGGADLNIDPDVAPLCARLSRREGGGRSVEAYVKENVEEALLPLMTRNVGAYGFGVFCENGKISVRSVTKEDANAYNAVKEKKQVMP
jgi:ATP-dependent Clp protease ATP-binding subunit ClpA